LLIRVKILYILPLVNGNRVEKVEQNAQRVKNKTRHYTYNVTLCRVCVIIFEVETIQYILCFFPVYLIVGTIFVILLLKVRIVL
jgi:hypothetical protein